MGAQAFDRAKCGFLKDTEIAKVMRSFGEPLVTGVGAGSGVEAGW